MNTETIIASVNPYFLSFIIIAVYLIIFFTGLTMMHYCSQRLADYRYYGDSLHVPHKEERKHLLYSIITLGFVFSGFALIFFNSCGINISYTMYPLLFLYLVYIYNAKWSKKPLTTKHISTVPKHH